MNRTSDIAKEVDQATCSYERDLRRRGGLSESDIEEEVRLYRYYVTAAFVHAVDELDDWLHAGRWLQ